MARPASDESAASDPTAEEQVAAWSDYSAMTYTGPGRRTSRRGMLRAALGVGTATAGAASWHHLFGLPVGALAAPAAGGRALLKSPFTLDEKRRALDALAIFLKLDWLVFVLIDALRQRDTASTNQDAVAAMANDLRDLLRQTKGAAISVRTLLDPRLADPRAADSRFAGDVPLVTRKISHLDSALQATFTGFPGFRAVPELAKSPLMSPGGLSTVFLQATRQLAAYADAASDGLVTMAMQDALFGSGNAPASDILPQLTFGYLGAAAGAAAIGDRYPILISVIARIGEAECTLPPTPSSRLPGAAAGTPVSGRCVSDSH